MNSRLGQQLNVGSPIEPFTVFKLTNFWIIKRFLVIQPSIKLLNLALIDLSKKLFQFFLIEMPSIDLKMWQHPEKHPDL